mmetsp:Transcript_10250/g.31321  ORF Transcript_10250/g.31321 Transcript_10250/m.31321 type:complete len:443 (+) Transcript_10250:195-1523(+)
MCEDRFFLGQILWHCVKFVAWILLSAVWWVIQRTLWFFTGTSQKMWASRSVRMYYESAHVQDVVFRFKFDTFLGYNRTNDFLLLHRGFVDPSYLLKDNVSLYAVNEREAIFVEADEGTQLWRSEHSSFLSLAQFHNARRVITLPLEQFHRFADEIGEPKAPLIFLPNVGRCGSTLLTQTIERTDRCVVYSEPFALTAVSLYFGDRGYPQSVVDLVARDVVRVLCKPVETPKQVDAFVFKPQAPYTDCVTLFGRLYPNAKQVFMWRHVKETASSLERLVYKLPLFYLPCVLPDWLNPVICWFSQICQNARISREDVRDMLRFPLLSGVYAYAKVMSQYKVFHSEGYKVVGVTYEDLVQNPEYAVTQIFNYCKLDNELVSLALRAFAEDSQTNSFVSKKSLQRVKGSVWTDEVKQTADNMLARYGMEGMDESFVHEGIITCKKN